MNQVGGNDQLVFDGSSFAMNGAGEIVASARSFDEDLVLADLDAGTGDRHENFTDECEAVYQALVMGTRDYIRKCGFARVLIGLSGGIDSSLTAAVAVEAVGRENVTGVAMPGPYSSDHSLSDAREMAEKLGIRFEVVPITGVYERFLQELAPLFGGDGRGRDGGESAIAVAGRDADGAFEQERRAGADHGKQERAGGGLLHSVWRYVRRAGGDQRRAEDHGVFACRASPTDGMGGAIPESVFTKPPSAELRPDQKDTDSLPEYEVLDRILEGYIEQIRTPRQIAESAWAARRAGSGHRQQSGPQRVQAPAGRAGIEGDDQGVWHRAAISHRAEVFSG